MKSAINFPEWVLAHAENIFCYMVYKHIYTPHEQQMAYTDESQFEDGFHFDTGFIREVVDIGNGEWLVGIEQVFDDGEMLGHIDYIRLSDLRLMYYPSVEERVLKMIAGEDEEDYE